MEKRNTNGSTAPPVTACMAPPEAAAMMSSWASVRSSAAGLPAAFIAASAPVGMKVSIAFSLSSPDAPPSCPRTRRSSAHLSGDARSRGTLGRKAWMNHGAVAGERRRLHDLVVPLDRERFRVLVHQNAKALAVKWDDEIVKATALTRDGAVIHPSFAPKSAA